MKFTKHMVLIAGVCALISMFIPYESVHAEGQSASASAFDVLTSGSVIGEQTKGAALLIWGPPVLLIVFGALAEKKKRFGRLPGGISLLFGASGTLFAAGLLAAIGDKSGSGSLEAAAGIQYSPGAGAYLLLAGSVLGLLGGLLALIKPDRGD